MGVCVNLRALFLVCFSLAPIMLEALSREFHTGCPWEMLYADDDAVCR